MSTQTFAHILSTMVLGAAGLATIAAQTAPDVAGTDVPRIEFEKYVLPNGLEVILSQNTRLPMVAVNLWYHVGPANEEPGRTGFAHLFEHMMFQSSKHVPADSHFKLLEAAGASSMNGTTDYDRTNYFETVPANQLELALWLESDRMGYLLEQVDQVALSNQQDVVRNERRQSVENRPYGPAAESVVQTLFPVGHPYYGYVIGSHEDIQAANLEDVRGFFRQYYAPNNASLAIVGDFQPDEAKGLVEKYFGTLRRGSAVPVINVETPAITEERRRIVPSRVELPRVYMAWLTPSIFEPGDAEAIIAANILGGEGRLYKKLVYEQQIAQNVAARQESLMLGSIFQIEVTARPGYSAEEIESAINAALEEFRAEPPTQAEVEQAQNIIESVLVSRLERLGGFGGIADRLNSYNHYLGTPDYLEEDILRYRAVTPAAVHEFARDQLASNARVVLHAVPGQPQAVAQAPTSGAPELDDQPADEAAVNVDEPWRFTTPSPGLERALRLAEPESVTLANGLTLILSERPGVHTVAANLVLKTGSDANPADRPGLASFVAAMLDEGTSTRSALQIIDEVGSFGASLDTGSSMDATTIAVRSLARNFPRVLELMSDVTLRPSFPDAEVERQRAARLARLVQQRDNAAQVASLVEAAALYGADHPYGYAQVGTEDSVRAMSKDEMVAFWRRNFVPNNAALVVAGDISMPELRSLAEGMFGGWRPGEPAEPRLDRPDATSVRVVIVDKPGAPQTQLRVVGIGAERSSTDFRPLQVMNTALGGQFSSRINMNLREEHGYTYGASSRFVFRRSPGPFVVSGAVRTDVTAAAVTEIFREVEGIIREPMAFEELQKVKSSLANSLPGAFETSVGVVNNFSNVYTYDLGLDYYSTYAEQVNAVTAEQALSVALRYLQPERLIVIAVGDRAVIEPKLTNLDLGVVEIWDAEGRPVR